MSNKQIKIKKINILRFKNQKTSDEKQKKLLQNILNS